MLYEVITGFQEEPTCPAAVEIPPFPNPTGATGAASACVTCPSVITSYSIHYTKLYEGGGRRAQCQPDDHRERGAPRPGPAAQIIDRLREAEIPLAMNQIEGGKKYFN